MLCGIAKRAGLDEEGAFFVASPEAQLDYKK
jgi:hypothetical protein